MSRPTARMSGLSVIRGEEPVYKCQHDWPEGTFLQGGGHGVVLGKNPYRTAFFEAFPNDPKCFLRGEGETVEEAEAACWEKWRSIVACPGHEWDRRGRRDGYAYCTHCALAGMRLDPLTLCHECSVPTRHGTDNQDRWYCEPHYEALPRELWKPWRVRMADEEPGDGKVVDPIGTLLGMLSVEAHIQQAVDDGREIDGLEQLLEEVASDD